MNEAFSGSWFVRKGLVRKKKKTRHLIFTHDYILRCDLLEAKVSRKLILIYNPYRTAVEIRFSIRISVPTAKNVVDDFFVSS